MKPMTSSASACPGHGVSECQVSDVSGGAWLTLSASVALAQPTICILEVANCPGMGQFGPLTVSAHEWAQMCAHITYCSRRPRWDVLPSHASAPLWGSSCSWDRGMAPGRGSCPIILPWSPQAPLCLITHEGMAVSPAPVPFWVPRSSGSLGIEVT